MKMQRLVKLMLVIGIGFLVHNGLLGDNYGIGFWNHTSQPLTCVVNDPWFDISKPYTHHVVGVPVGGNGNTIFTAGGPVMKDYRDHANYRVWAGCLYNGVWKGGYIPKGLYNSAVIAFNFFEGGTVSVSQGDKTVAISLVAP